jgi:RNA polymerase sigma-70 factor (ECF subfamily)
MTPEAALADVVEAARRGSSEAWSELVRRHQDLAVATAVGWLGSVDDARDAAQDAFVLAFTHLDELADPQAFTAWFGRLVRTASSRRSRRAGPPSSSVDDPSRVAADGDPALAVIRRAERERVRTAVEALPEAERTVIALHYLGGLTYPQVARFLGIGLATAKMRAHRARRRLQEVLPMAADLLSNARPSRSDRFRDGLLLFEAIRRHDAVAVASILARDPSLVGAEEDWTPAEAFSAHVPFAAHATPLVRAAGAGDVGVVRVLLDAGADPGGRCGCAGGESPLWAATVVGAADVVKLLLDRGADPNVPAFQGATPLHVASQRSRHDLVHLLVAAGADPEAADPAGRTPADWSLAAPARSAEAAGEIAVTGIRALDLFAPLSRGCRQWWPAGYGLGQLVVLLAVADGLHGVEPWWIGFEQDLVDALFVEHGMAELGVRGTVRLAPRDLDAAAARRRFFEAVEAAASAGGSPRVVVCLDAPGHRHEVALALPGLAAAENVVATLVADAYEGTWPAGAERPPDGYDAMVTFDPVRARRGLYPALDPGATASRRYPSQRHERLATEARALLGHYAETDPELLLPDANGPAERLIRYLAQPLATTTPFTSQPGEWTAYAELLDRVEQLLT